MTAIQTIDKRAVIEQCELPNELYQKVSRMKLWEFYLAPVDKNKKMLAENGFELYVDRVASGKKNVAIWRRKVA